MQLTSIVPRLPPAIDGVGDYALRLATQLRQDFGVQTRFIVGNPNWKGTGAITPKEKILHSSAFPAQPVGDRSQVGLLHLLQGGSSDTHIVLLHYVPHGYAKKACPFWLIEALRQWRKQPQTYLITFFHELYALDWHRPWSTDLWLSPVQQHLASQLAQLSDVCLTSTERYVHQIRKLSHGKHKDMPILSIFSNVGELKDVSPFSQRQRHLVIFGQQHSKMRVYQDFIPLLQKICGTLAIEAIFDLGPKTGLTPARIGNVSVEELGERTDSEISQQLSRSLAGFICYDPRRLGKSGIFAAYCAHGVLPINHQGLPQSVDGLIAGTHYWVPDRFPTLELETAQAIVDRAYAWYQDHRIEKHARIVYQCLPTPDTAYAMVSTH
jgi:hypothetical protein